MTDKSQRSKSQISPANESSVPEPEPEFTTFEKIIGPFGFSRAARHNRTSVVAQSNSVSPKDVTSIERTSLYVEPQPRTRKPERRASLRTGLDISAIALNETKSHVVIAGSNVFQVLKLGERSMEEELNIRESVSSYMSTQTLRPDEIHQRREFLVAKAVAWSHRKYSHVVATAAVNGRVALWDVSRSASRVELSRLYRHKGQVNEIDFDPHAGYMMLTGSSDKTVQVWDIRSPNEPRAHTSFPETSIRASVRDVKWSPTDAFHFALCTEEGLILKWDIRNNRQPLMGVPRAHEKSCYAISWHPDGKYLASGGLDKNLKVWDVSGEHRIKKPYLQLRCPASIMRLAWRPASHDGDCTQIATSYDDWDHRIHVWDWRRPFVSQREFNMGADGPVDFLWKDKDQLLSVSGGSSGVVSQADILYQRSPVQELPPVGICIGPRTGRVWSFAYPCENESDSSYPAGERLNDASGRISGSEEGVVSRSLTDDEAVDMEFHSGLDKTTKSFRSKREANTPPTQGKPIIATPLDVSMTENEKLAFSNHQSLFEGFEIPDDEVKSFINDLAEPFVTAEPSSIIDNLDRAFIHNSDVCSRRGYRMLAYHWWLAREYVIPELTAWADWNRKIRLEGDQVEGVVSKVMNIDLSEEPKEILSVESESTESQTAKSTRSKRKPLTACNPWLLERNESVRLEKVPEDDPSMSVPYDISDFKPIDITHYSPLNDWWIMSTYGTIVENIYKSLDNIEGIPGLASAAHLLSYLVPFFFHPSQRTLPTQADHFEIEKCGYQLTNRLRHPAFSGRAIMGIYASYIDYLDDKKLFLLERVMRHVAVQAGFPKLASRDAFEDNVQQGEKLDTSTSGVMIACTNCNQMMLSVQGVCKFCKEPRSPCPICELSLLTHPPSIQDGNKLKQLLNKLESAKITFCHQCGHSAHTDCMEGWLLSEGAQGRCPVPDCDDDCAPGIYRDARIARQIAARENEAAVRGSVSSTNGMKVQKDPIRAGSSAAVDKARDTLRKRSSVTERATQSGDERTPSSGGGSVWSRGTSFGKRRVKIIEPGEEEGPDSVQ